MRILPGLVAAVLMPVVAVYAELPSAPKAAVTQALSSGKPAVIDLGARSCRPCKKMAPILESLSAEYRGRAAVMFIDVRDDEEAAEKFKVQMIPTQIFFDARGREVKRHMGFMSKPDIVKELQALGVR
jgi:thioredoxin 1